MRLPFLMEQTPKSGQRSLGGSIRQRLTIVASEKLKYRNEAQPHSRVKFGNRVLDSWILNYTALCLSFLSLASILAVLGYYNGYALSSW